MIDSFAKTRRMTAEFLREVSEGARAIARTVLPPWRTPLLLCLLGTLLLVLEMGQAEPERLRQQLEHLGRVRPAQGHGDPSR